jgi:hypothetical protein
MSDPSFCAASSNAIAERYKRAELAEPILNPSAKIAQGIEAQ